MFDILNNVNLTVWRKAAGWKTASAAI